jgi:hypothetical protein
MWHCPSVLIEALESFQFGLRKILNKGSNLIAQALSLTQWVVHSGPKHKFYFILHSEGFQMIQAHTNTIIGTRD